MSIFKRQEKKKSPPHGSPLKTASSKSVGIFDLMDTSGNDGVVENPPRRQNIETETPSEIGPFDDLDALNGLGYGAFQATEIEKTESGKNEVAISDVVETETEPCLDTVEDSSVASEESSDIFDAETIGSLEATLTDDDADVQNVHAEPTDMDTQDLISDIEESLAELDSVDEPPEVKLNATQQIEPFKTMDFQSTDTSVEPIETNESTIASIYIGAPHIEVEDDVPNETSAEVDTTEISAMRYDLNRITTDVEKGDALYKRAQSRIRSLTQFAEKAEVSFSLVARLEPENRRLKTKNLNLIRDLEAANHLNARLQTDLDTHVTRLNEVNTDMVSVNDALGHTVKSLTKVEKELAVVKHDRDLIKLKADRDLSAFNLEVLENSDLRSKIAEFTEQVEVLSAEKVNVLNELQSLKIDYEDELKARESAEAASLDSGMALEESQKQNSKMSVHLNTIKEDVKSFKTQYEYTLVNRDDRIFALESEVSALSKQLSLKDEILANASMDAANLRKTRTAGDSERERLETLIKNQSQQLQLAEEQLLQSRANIQELDKRYKEAAAALSHVHSRRQHQSPASNPDIYPASEGSGDFDALEKFISD